MAHLPFLVAHGWWIGKLLVVWLAVTLYALLHARRARRDQRATPLQRAVIACGCVGLSYLALWGVGANALSHVDRTRDLARDQTALGSFDGLAIAAAMPRVRQEALAELAAALDDKYERSEDILAARAELAELRGGCAMRARELLAQEHFADAARAAHGCDDNTEAVALADLGRWTDAAAVDRDHIEIAIMADQWMRAADTLARSIAAFPIMHVGDETGMHEYPRDTCLVWYLRALGGDAGARAKLVSDAAARTRLVGGAPMCEVGLALLEPDATVRRDSLALLAKKYDHGALDLDVGKIAILAWADGATSEESIPAPFYQMPATGGEPSFAWLAPWAVPGPDGDMGTITAERVVLDVIRGDSAAAIAAVAALRTNVTHAIDVETLETAVELHTERAPIPQPASARPLLRDSVALRDGEARPFDSLLEGFCHRTLAPALRDARAGHGAALATVLRRCDVFEPFEFGRRAALYAVIPRIQDGRDQVAAALRVTPGGAVGTNPLRLVPYYAMRRDLARLAGDVEAAAQWQALVDAHLPALHDRQRVVALLLLR